MHLVDWFISMYDDARTCKPWTFFCFRVASGTLHGDLRTFHCFGPHKLSVIALLSITQHLYIVDSEPAAQQYTHTELIVVFFKWGVPVVFYQYMYVNVNKKVQLDATVCRHLFTAKSLYMFRVSQHPSSGALKTVTATSCIGHSTSTATSFQRGLIRTSN